MTRMEGAYLAEAAPGRVQHNNPWLLPSPNLEQVLYPRPAEVHNARRIEEICSCRTGPVAGLGRGLILPHVALVETTLLRLGILPPPSPFPLVLPGKHGPGAGFTADGHVPLECPHKAAETKAHRSTGS